MYDGDTTVATPHNALHCIALYRKNHMYILGLFAVYAITYLALHVVSISHPEIGENLRCKHLHSQWMLDDHVSPMLGHRCMESMQILLTLSHDCSMQEARKCSMQRNVKRNRIGSDIESHMLGRKVQYINTVVAPVSGLDQA
jgi:hypothetical protein